MVATSASEYSRRAERLIRNVDGTVLLTSSRNIFYFTGFMGEGIDRLIAFVSGPQGSTLLVPSLHRDEAISLNGHFDVMSWDDSQDPVGMLAGLLSKGGDISLEGNMRASLYSQIEGTKSFVDAKVESMRAVKGEDEVSNMKEASRIAEKSFSESLGEISENMTESRLASILEQKFIENGAQAPAFPSIVSFGENGANPHHNPGKRKLRRNESIVIDFGCAYNHYNSDTTRTVHFGKPSAEFEQVYDAVLEAQETGCSQLRAGLSGRDIDSSVRKKIAGRGYADRFIHRTGHGIGLDVHEVPYVDQKNIDPLKEGNCVTVEPGIYLTGKFGVRIEDVLVVGKNHSRNLNSLTKQFTVV